MATCGTLAWCRVSEIACHMNRPKNLALMWAIGLVFVTFSRAAESSVRFKGESGRSYQLVVQTGIANSVESNQWIRAMPASGGQAIWFELNDSRQLLPLLQKHRLNLVSTLGNAHFLLEAPHAMAALAAAQAMQSEPAVIRAVPVRRNSIRQHGTLAPQPNDPYYPLENHLETVDPTTPFAPSAPDLNIREAWAVTRGGGIGVGIGDDGVDDQHPDLASNIDPTSFNFITGVPSGSHTGRAEYHGTAVAGLLAAVTGNRIGVAGVAPGVRLASWVIFDEYGQPASDDELASMWTSYNSGSPLISVQSHSWGNSDTDFLPISDIEWNGIQAAETEGRDGLGTVIVRSAGNNRAQNANGNFSVGDANLDQYANDPHQISVAAVLPSGWAASYSDPGACVRVAAPSGDTAHGVNGLTTTDPVGANGQNIFIDPNNPESADYVTGLDGFSGTSAAAPQVAGLAALTLAVNPGLTARDLGLILSLAARHPHLLDPELVTNAAGFALTHSLGFGVPDAGLMVDFAKRWSNRPPETVLRYTNSSSQPIPDDGFRFQVRDSKTKSIILDIPASGSLGLHPDQPTSWKPLYDVGTADSSPTINLSNDGAVIHVGGLSYATAIGRVAAAGAGFGVVIYNQNSTRKIMPGTDYVPIPAALISENDGKLLQAIWATNSALEGNLLLQSARFTFPAKSALTVENVQVQVSWNHPRSADLRVTLQSPSGTVSILHRPGGTANPVPSSWTYSSVRYLGEPSLGTWTVAVTDEATGQIGNVNSVELILSGVAIVDRDGDGLDDTWEIRHFGNLRSGSKDDPDGDGWNNAIEQLMGSDPTVNDRPLLVTLSNQQQQRFRLSWPGLSGLLYQVESTPNLQGPWSIYKVVPGHYPESVLFFEAGQQPVWFRVRTSP